VPSAVFVVRLGSEFQYWALGFGDNANIVFQTFSSRQPARKVNVQVSVFRFSTIPRSGSGAAIQILTVFLERNR